MSLEATIRARRGSFLLDVAFTAPGGITALFGPSGAGKTQTLRCIAGLVRPDAGRIIVDGRVLLDSAARINIPARERRIGYVFQHYALFPHMDVAGNIGYGLHRLTSAARRARTAEMLELVGLPGYERRFPGELSAGQQQRVALARALAPAPDVLLLDEPFSAVDALARRQLRQELRTVQERTAIPMLLVTHDLAEVRQVATFMVLYEQGRVLQTGIPDEVLTSPGSETVAALLEAASGVS